MMPKISLKNIFALSIIFGLCACGVTGTLENAPPMWGKAKAEYEAQKVKDAADKAAAEAAAKAEQEKVKQ